MINAAVEGRRWVGKIVLFFTLCWVLVLVAGVGGALQGSELEPMRFALFLIPGCAFVPAAYFAVRLHMTSDREQLDALWPKTLVYGIAGLVLLFGLAYGLYQMDQS